jgi:4-carboxymuconolactone decarboxylase
VESEREGVMDHEEMLRKLSLGDDAYIEGVLAGERANETGSSLDGKTHALVRIAALVAIDATTPSYLEAIRCAQRWGASTDEILGCLVAVIPAVGMARVVSAAPKIGLALGYDVDAALEAHATPIDR